MWWRRFSCEVLSALVLLTSACEISEQQTQQATPVPSFNAAGEPLSQLVLSHVNGLRSRARELRAVGNAEEATRVDNQADRVLRRAAAVGKPLEASRSRHHRAAKLGQLKKLKRDMGDSIWHPELPA